MTSTVLQICNLIRNITEHHVSRVAQLGNWPTHIRPEGLLARIPTDEKSAPGLDAGLCCALDIIPREKQKLSAGLHAAYTPELVTQVRNELVLDADSDTTYWLACCNLCEDGLIGPAEFVRQVGEATFMLQYSKERRDSALEELNWMYTKVSTQFGVSFGTEDGCIQAAYLQGAPFAIHYSKEYDLYFIGTYFPSLGLENFEWSLAKDSQGRAKSGPVWGSKQFVKCADQDELLKALPIVKAQF